MRCNGGAHDDDRVSETTTYHLDPSRPRRPNLPRLWPALAPSARGFIVSRAITRHSIRGEAPRGGRSRIYPTLPRSSGRQQLPQHGLQDPAVLEVVELVV